MDTTSLDLIIRTKGAKKAQAENSEMFSKLVDFLSKHECYWESVVEFEGKEIPVRLLISSLKEYSLGKLTQLRENEEVAEFVKNVISLGEQVEELQNQIRQ